MPAIDSFEVIEVIRGRLYATSIYVDPFSPKGSAYPENLTEGDILTLRLTLFDETWERAEENEREGGLKMLVVNRNELEAIEARPAKKAARVEDLDPGGLGG